MAGWSVWQLALVRNIDRGWQMLGAVFDKFASLG